MGKVFQLVILNPCIVLGGINIDSRLRVQGVECVLTLTQIVSMNIY